jgi:hypothetical protein
MAGRLPFDVLKRNESFVSLGCGKPSQLSRNFKKLRDSAGFELSLDLPVFNISERRPLCYFCPYRDLLLLRGAMGAVLRLHIVAFRSALLDFACRVTVLFDLRLIP